MSKKIGTVPNPPPLDNAWPSPPRRSFEFWSVRYRACRGAIKTALTAGSAGGTR
jgi:hypothetical protein